MSLSSHQSAKSSTCDWLTPPEWIEALGPFDTDPCASRDQPWRTATLQWDVSQDGLARQWTGFTWLNPPYGPPSVITPWMKKMALHRDGIACIPARTETQMWFDYVWLQAHAVLFVKGRPHFHYPVTGVRGKSNSGAPIALVAYGENAVHRLFMSGIGGHLVPLRYCSSIKETM